MTKDDLKAPLLNRSSHQMGVPHHKTRSTLKKHFTENYESLNLEPTRKEANRTADPRTLKRQIKRKQFNKWVIALAVGVIMGVCGKTLDSVLVHFVSFRSDLVHFLIVSLNTPLLAFLFYISINILFAFISAAIIQYISVAASGSGLPSLRAFLNGVNIPGIVTGTTFWAKLTSFLFVGASGMVAGSAGPMVHTGSALAVWLARISFNGKRVFPGFDTDADVQELVMWGSSAGIAAAYGAPTGATLFSLDNLSMFTRPSLLWRSYFSAIFTVLTFVLVATYIGNETDPRPGIFSFGVFDSPRYSFVDLVNFMIVGIIAGIIGAAVIRVVKILLNTPKFQPKTSTGKISKVMIVSICYSIVSFIMPLMKNDCLPTTEAQNLERFQCVLSDYSPSATLFFSSHSTTLQYIVHHDSMIPSSTLILWIITTLCFATITGSGLSVSGGLLVPSMLVGAGLGRVYGQYTHNSERTLSSSKIYAWVGASAVASGVFRSSLSLILIMVEATWDTRFALPIAFAVVTSRAVSAKLSKTRGLNDMVILNKMIPFLPEKPASNMSNHQAKDIMSAYPISFPERVSVSQIKSFLSNCSHHAFPVFGERESDNYETVSVTTGNTINPQIFLGFVMRNDLLLALSLLNYLPIEADINKEIAFAQLVLRTTKSMHPNFPTIDDIVIHPKYRSRDVNVGQLVNICSINVPEDAPLTLVFDMFHLLKLRHVAVINQFNECTGIITRKDLLVFDPHTPHSNPVAKGMKRKKRRAQHNTRINYVGPTFTLPQQVQMSNPLSSVKPPVLSNTPKSSVVVSPTVLQPLDSEMKNETSEEEDLDVHQSDSPNDDTNWLFA
ncbi:hypothetical protein PCE1_003399 [Barthelona sp. PCE]